MWQSLVMPSGLAQQQANLLANAKDELKLSGLVVPAGHKVEPAATFDNVAGVAKAAMVWKLTFPDGTYVNLLSLDTVKNWFR